MSIARGQGADCPLRYLPGTLAVLTALRELRVSVCCISRAAEGSVESFPSALGRLASLTALELSSNTIACGLLSIVEALEHRDARDC
jgi:hypothetical protein